MCKNYIIKNLIPLIIKFWIFPKMIHTIKNFTHFEIFDGVIRIFIYILIVKYYLYNVLISYFH